MVVTKVRNGTFAEYFHFVPNKRVTKGIMYLYKVFVDISNYILGKTRSTKPIDDIIDSDERVTKGINYYN